MILLIDNYDSFTYNLYQYFGELGADIIVKKNDEITVEEVEKYYLEKDLRGIVISPGPKAPKDAGICIDVIKKFYKLIPILGICLGHQCIGEAFGGEIVHANKMMHGKKSKIKHNEKGILNGISNPLEVARYHSLVISKEDFPDDLEILSMSDDNEIMAVKHKKYKVYGLQFHPESVYTQKGHEILLNYLNETKNVKSEVLQVDFR